MDGEYQGDDAVDMRCSLERSSRLVQKDWQVKRCSAERKAKGKDHHGTPHTDPMSSRTPSSSATGVDIPMANG